MSADDLDLLSEDCSAVDHRLQLFLDVDVFEEEEEELRSFLKVRNQEPGFNRLRGMKTSSRTSSQPLCYF